MPRYFWNAAAAACVVALTLAAYAAAGRVSPRAASGFGVAAFFLVAVAASADVRAINWRLVGGGLSLQVALALTILHVDPVYNGFRAAGEFVKTFLEFTDSSVATLFGTVWPTRPLALVILPTVVFVASVFAVLFHLRVLQAVVWVLARGLVLLLGRRGASGAEALSAVANVFMGQTEAPLMIAPYVARMTRSELTAVMVGGMATIAGGVMAAYIGMGADAVAILATSVMAAPCGLVIAKVLVPETEQPVTRGEVRTAADTAYANVIDAAAGGASDGMKLAINIIAMLIAFGALIVMANYLLGLAAPGLTLEAIFARLFAPAAVLMGVDAADVPAVGGLLGIKLVGNEFLAFDAMTRTMRPGLPGAISERSYALATYALTGFANVGSIGIQLGGIGALGRDPADQAALRGRLARLGPRALLGGFLATLLNAAVAGVIR